MTRVVAIAGFKMPKCCIECVLYDHFTGCCAILDECIYDEEEEDNDFGVEKERYYACPLREISFEIEIMRKYKKIQEIVKKWELDSWTDNLSYESMIQIREVLEDGNDD